MARHHEAPGAPSDGRHLRDAVRGVRAGDSRERHGDAKLSGMEPLWKRALRNRETKIEAEREQKLKACRSVGRQHGEMVRAGQERARARGARFGRPKNSRLTSEVLERARVMLVNGMKLREVAMSLSVPTTTLHRALPGVATRKPGQIQDAAAKGREVYWSGTTPEERRQRMEPVLSAQKRETLVENGRKVAEFMKDTPHEQRQEWGRQGAKARWAKK